MSSIIGVAQLNRYIALKLKNDVKLSGVTVRGEITDFKVHYKSGHSYFALKEDGSQIKCVMFKNQLARNAFKPENGVNVLCTGDIEVYEPNGVYQIIAREMIPVGIGAKFLQIEAIKKKLAEKGYFSEERKKPLPPLPKRIAVVTSLNGAALRDVLNILGRRYPVGEVLLFPSQVQGDTAHLTIVDALKRADKSGCDVIILTRGGGSYEDLMAFNTEEVASAVAECDTPIISAVGHETDTTLADSAADVRAPTPSAAAEICAPEAEQLLGAIDYMEKRLSDSMEVFLRLSEQRLDELESKLSDNSPHDRLDRESEHISALSARMRAAADRAVEREETRLETLGMRFGAAYDRSLNEKQNRFETLLARLETLDPYSVLERGYTITMKDGVPVTNADALDSGDEIVIRFRDRSVTARVTSTDGGKG